MTTPTTTSVPTRPQPPVAVPVESSPRRRIRHPWAWGITLLVVAGALFGPPAVVDFATQVEPQGIRLDPGPAYVLTAPLGTIWDSITLMTAGQHYALPISLMLIYAGWRAVRRRRRLGLARRIGVEVVAGLAAFGGLLAFYAYGALGPRPMVGLAVEDPDVVVIDFHSHTEHSHDGRPGFDAEDRRAWHAAGGFDAAYISDHRTYDGWREAERGNPERAGAGTVLLPALEIRYRDMYVNALGVPARYEPARDGNNLDAAGVSRLAARAGRPPTFVLSVFAARGLDPRHTARDQGVVAVEMTEAAPKGLRRSRLDRELLVSLPDSLGVAPVSASAHHGWGRAVAAWTLMRIPGWQQMTPARLGSTIETRLHRDREDATRVIERRMPWPGGSPAALALTLPAVTWNLFGGLTLAERVSWLAWTWLLALLVIPRLRARPWKNAEA